MANHGSPSTTDAALESAFLKDRQAMLGGFVNFTTYAVVGIAVLLVLMAIFLI
jgi:hypothetical protein